MKTGDSWEDQQSKDQSMQAGRPCSRFHQGSLIQCTAKKSIGASYVNCKDETFETIQQFLTGKDKE
jgi:hypothetical protein